MILSVEQLQMTLRVATLVIPVGVYFLILGLLNSRRRPQLLTGRQDFALLVLALSPMVLLPVLNLFGVSLVTVLAGAALLGGGIWLLGPSDRRWVIYNLPNRRAADVLAGALDRAGLDYHTEGKHFMLDDSGQEVHYSSFPMLKNVMVRLDHPDADLAGRLEQSLAEELACVRAETSPATMTMLMVSVAVLVAPLVLVVGRADEIVRILTDLLP